MELLPNGITLQIPPGAFPLSTDSMVLADFVRLPRQTRVLDLGSGCGTLGLLLCASHADCHITGIELERCAHQAAVKNIRRNALEDRMTSICADLRHLPPELPKGSFPCVISNPPYFSGGPASVRHPVARREDCCSSEELFRAATDALRFGGTFYLVHRPERMAELIACAARHTLEAKRLRLIRHHCGGPVTLVLLAFRKGGKPGLLWEEEALFEPSGTPTDFYRRVYHLD